MRLSVTLSKHIAHGLLEAYGRTLTPGDIAQTRIRAERNEAIDYSRSSAAFAYLYWGANFLKAHHAVASIITRLPFRPLRIVDLGCGSGAATAALIEAVRASGRTVETVVGVDHSPAHLRWYSRVIDPWAECNVTTHCTDALQYLASRPSCDIVVASYLLTELLASQRGEVMDLLTAPGIGQYLIIDNDPFGHPIVRSTDEIARSLDSRMLGGISLPFLEDVRFATLPRYAHRPSGTDPAHLRRLLDEYFAAWQSHDVTEIARIFAPDASYNILGKRSLFGIESIQRYWLENSEEQGDVLTSHPAVDVSNDSITSQWSATFPRRDRNQLYELQGWMTLLVKDDRIRTLIERFEKRTHHLGDQRTMRVM